jgi:hypothetical protein
MDKKTATEEFKEIEYMIKSLEKERAYEIEELMKQKIYPLLEQIKQITEDVKDSVDKKYNDLLLDYKIQKTEIETILDDFKIEEANELWYAKGTVVTLWKSGGSIFRKEVKRTDLKGVVEIYDGTQQMPSIPEWKLPKKGDILVRHIKKDGTLGLKFDQISEYGEIKRFIPYWFSEDDTFNDNLIKRRYENEEN